MNQFTIIIIIAISAVFFSAQWIPQKKAGNLEDPRLYNFTMSFGILIGCVSSFILINFFIPLTTYEIYPILISLLAGVIWQFANIFIVNAVNEIGMGQTTVLMNLITVFSFIFGIIFFQEIPTIFDLMGFFSIITGSILISLIKKEKDSRKSYKGILLLLIGTLLISIFNTLSLESMNSPYFPTVPYHVSCLYVAIGIVIGNFFVNIKPKRLKNWWNLGNIHKFAIFGGLFWSGGIVLISYALFVGGLGFGISIVQALILIFGALWGILYFKEIIERKNLLIFLLGAIIVIIGIFLFTF